MTVQLTLAQRFDIDEQHRRDTLYKEAADAVEQIFDEKEKEHAA